MEDKWLVFSLGTITNKTYEYLCIAFFFKWFIPFYVLVFCLHVYSMCGWCEQVERGSGAMDPLEMELQMAVNHYTGARKRTRVLCKSNRGC